MHVTAGPTAAWRPAIAMVLLVGWLVGALAATTSGSVLLAPSDPCGAGSDCAGLAIFITEYAIRHGPLLLFLTVLPLSTARLLRHGDSLPIIAIGAGAVAVLLATSMLIAAVKG